jgi:hypothetical protein
LLNLKLVNKIAAAVIISPEELNGKDEGPTQLQ